MVHRLFRGFGVALLGVLLSASVALAGNLSGSGQPGAECGDEDASVMPQGFTTGGFATAEGNYAGSGDASVTNAGSDHAVSQYDVACYQLTLHAH
jgi:hypothetical protein